MCPQLAAEIAKVQARLNERIEVWIETVRAKLTKLAFANLADFVSIACRITSSVLRRGTWMPGQTPAL
jgi:hypothetical protein